MNRFSSKRLVLAADDNPSDRKILQEAFRDVDTSVEVHFVEDGDELLDYLCRRGAYAETRSPNLVLLDLSMPRLDGKQALAAIKSDPRLRPIPVIVLTGSQAAQDICAVYEQGATTYFSKPANFEDLVRIVAAVCEFWFRTTRLPEPD